MPFRRTANAIVSKTAIHFDEWMEELRAQNEGIVSRDYIGRIAKSTLKRCDPKQYLLSHATIVASVDVYAPKGSKTGRRIERGCQIDVRYPDFRIKPECQDIVNNNGDAWERSLLLSTYKTFIGAPNYLEHVQIPELSKGFIVDAIARDLGETCYIDILVATDRKHQMLASDILAGNIAAMSMGCISLFTVCSRCGNVAVDDTQLCPHILYDGKGSKFVSEDDGMEHRLAELIGHVSVQNSNQFIEASWVRNPAFHGAQRRNILNPDAAAVVAALDRGAEIYEIRRHDIDLDGLKKVASATVAAEGDEPTEADELDEAADAAEGGSDDAPAAGPEAAKPGMKGLVEQAKQMLMESLISNLEEELSPKPQDVGTATPSGLEAGADMNETLLSASDFRRRLESSFAGHPAAVEWATKAMASFRRTGGSALSSRDLIVLSWINDTVRSNPCPPAIYQAVMSAGPLRGYPSKTSFLAACRIKLGRSVSADESAALLRIGKVASKSKNL